MKCERCIEGRKARYRVYSDVMDMKVCASCAAEAQSLRLTIEVLPQDDLVEVDSRFSRSQLLPVDLQLLC
ncbi:MAG TPA: hypothetical protein VLX11_11720 [Candidatus Acidoferrales bacterium]|nr:hypothetical protein [Candidatus Acidoferrales bacterium]